MTITGRKVSTWALVATMSVALSACGWFRDDETVAATQAGAAARPAPATTTVVGQVQPIQPAPVAEQRYQRTLQK